MNRDSNARCWAISRELAHSPGRESDDALILRRTAERLEAAGFAVTIRSPEDVAADGSEPPPFVFLMCERMPILDRLAAWEKRGVVMINSIEGVRNTYRDRTIAVFRRSRISFPASAIVETAAPAALFPSETGYWVKRADVHSTQPGDVTRAPDAESVLAALARLAERGLSAAVVQEHVPGDLIKFYGVGRGDADERDWFEWFYHREQRLAGHRFEPAELERLARAAAAALGLEIFGGDAIATAEGRLVLIDLNAWPSFALFREEASHRIAAHLAARFRKEAGALI
jgi:glutathione synthase/RimK-type ligase-like ATP-grasp enzyme